MDKDTQRDMLICIIKKAMNTHMSIPKDMDDFVTLDSNDFDHIAEDAADEILANDIGNLAEWKRRAEVAEQKYEIALEKVCHTFQKYPKHYQTALKRFDDEITRQAEHEIEEENNGKK